jgi:hypothetical protein
LPNSKISEHHFCGGKKLPKHTSLIYDLAFFLAGLASQVVFSKDLTVWLNLPTTASHPPSWVTRPATVQHSCPQKYVWKY